MINYCITKSYHFKIFDWLVLKLQDIETETLKPHYIHVYKVFGEKFCNCTLLKRLIGGFIHEDTDIHKQDVFVKHWCPRWQQSQDWYFSNKGHDQGHKVGLSFIKKIRFVMDTPYVMEWIYVSVLTAYVTFTSLFVAD